jgi:hypothetical protein
MMKKIDSLAKFSSKISMLVGLGNNFAAFFITVGKTDRFSQNSFFSLVFGIEEFIYW